MPVTSAAYGPARQAGSSSGPSAANVPAHLGGIGSGALVTLQQAGLALDVATLGTLYLTLAPRSYPHAFAAAEYVQMGIVALLAIGAAALPRFSKASADAPVIDG